MLALLPDLRGYEDSDASDYTDNAQDSPIVFILLREDLVNLPEAEKFKRIYLNYVADDQGKPGPYGLTQFTFRDDSGYRGEDLFVGQTPKGMVVLRCVRLSASVPSPSCLRDLPQNSNVALSYRFKRAQLAQWREIGDSVSALIHRFHTHKSGST